MNQLLNPKAPVSNSQKKVAVYERESELVDFQTGEIKERETTTINKVSAEPDFIKVYYQQMLIYTGCSGVPVDFILSLSKFIEWSNEGSPMVVTLNSRAKSILMEDCAVKLAQVNRYIKSCVESGVLLKTEYRGVYEVNPFFIAKGKWESIKRLQAQFDYTDGKWSRKVYYEE